MVENSAEPTVAMRVGRTADWRVELSEHSKVACSAGARAERTDGCLAATRVES